MYIDSMNKKFIVLAGIAVFFGAVFSGAVLWKTAPASANQSTIQVYTNSTTTPNSNATTSLQYLAVATAASTLLFDSTNSHVIQIYFAVHSTNTPAQVYTGLDFSNNNLDWYPFQFVAQGASVALSAGQTGDLFSWTAATTSADQIVYKTASFVLDNFAGKYGRLRYKLAGSAAEVHVEIAQKKEF